MVTTIPSCYESFDEFLAENESFKRFIVSWSHDGRVIFLKKGILTWLRAKVKWDWWWKHSFLMNFILSLELSWQVWWKVSCLFDWRKESIDEEKIFRDSLTTEWMNEMSPLGLEVESLMQMQMRKEKKKMRMRMRMKMGMKERTKEKLLHSQFSIHYIHSFSCLVVGVSRPHSLSWYMSLFLIQFFTATACASFLVRVHRPRIRNKWKWERLGQQGGVITPEAGHESE